MAEDKLKDRARVFSREISEFCQELKNRQVKGSTINQLYRSARSVYANVKEAHYARGRVDFASKLRVALMECSESEGWLEMLYDDGFISSAEFSRFKNMCIEICRIGGKSIRTAEENAADPDKRKKRWHEQKQKANEQSKKSKKKKQKYEEKVE